MRSSRSKRELADRLATWLLVIVSLVALFITVYSLLSLIKSFGWNGLDLTTSVYLVLTIFSLIGIAIGLERYGVLEGMRAEQAEVTHALHSSIDCRTLTSTHETYEEARRLIEYCTGNEIIRATTLGISHEERDLDFDRYLDALAKKIRDTKRRGGTMRYRVIMGMQLDAQGTPPPDKQQAILTRRKKFKNYDVLNDRLMQIKYLETRWSLDIVIVGTEHLIIGFPALEGDRQMVMSLRVSDRSFVERVASWYDEHLWNAKAVKDVTWTGGIV
jgi:hypothetical protein